jgi:tetratricopeptide (TPR) repeat protein
MFGYQVDATRLLATDYPPGPQDLEPLQPRSKSGDRPGEKDHAEAARLAQEAIDQSRQVRRSKYELAARLVLGQALIALGQPEAGIDELRTVLDGIRRLGHPPTLWRAWGTLGTALTQAGEDDEAAAAVAAAANTLRTFAATLAPERAGPLLAAEPSREILSAGGSS